MRAIIQRVKKARVEIENTPIAAIDKGLLVFVGIEDADEETDVSSLVSKIVNLRIFADLSSKMNLSLKDVKGQILIVSQFTLLASTKKGNRPSFIKAAKPQKAIALYNKFIEQTQKLLDNKVQTGQFGADMNVILENDGPVTIFIDTKNRD